VRPTSPDKVSAAAVRANDRPSIFITNPSANFRRGKKSELKSSLVSVDSVDEEHLIITEASTARGSRIVCVGVSLRIVTRRHVIDRRPMNVGGTVCGCSRRRAGGAENNRNGKRYICLAEHVRTLWLSWVLSRTSRPVAARVSSESCQRSHTEGRPQKAWNIPRIRWLSRHSRRCIHGCIEQAARE
jgi:hypothetical protein